MAFVTFGEGLQNNHHAFPGAYRHGMRWWEPDLSGWVIYGLSKLGIVWDLHMPTDENDRQPTAEKQARKAQTPLRPTPEMS